MSHMGIFFFFVDRKEAKKDSYWTSDNFLQQIIKKAADIADLKYPPSEGYKVKWSFDNSSCHNAYSRVECVAMHMITKNGGKQYCMTDPCSKRRYTKLLIMKDS